MSLDEGRKQLLERMLAEAGQASPDTPQKHISAQVVPDTAHRYEPFPLTDIQLAYWLGRDSQAELGGVASHGYQEIAYPTLDTARYSAAWNKVIARHDMMRAIIRPDGTQQVLRHVDPLVIQVADHRNSPPDQAEAARMATRGRMAAQVFDPTIWPAMEIAMTRMPDGRDIVHISADALFGDVYSSFVIFHELRQFYDQPASDLPGLDFTFRDYVIWLKAQEDSPEFAAAQRYWVARAATLPPAPQFPPLPTTQDNAAQHHGFIRRRFALPGQDWAKLRQAGQRHGAGPSALVLTVFAQLIARWTEEYAFTLNVTTFNRADIHPQAPAIVGDFTHTMLFGIDLAPQAPLHDSLRQVQISFANDFEHRQFGGVRTLREMNRRNGVDGAAAGPVLMPIVFTSGLGAGDLAKAIPEPSRHFGQRLFEITQTPQVTLDHQVFEENDALIVQWDYQPGAFPPGLPEDMFAAYEDGICRLAANPDLWRSETLFTPPKDHIARRIAANATDADIAPARLETGFLRQATDHPDRTALICGEHTVSYGALYQRAAGWARNISDVRDGRVLICMNDPADRVAAALGCAIAGRAYVPVEPDWPMARRAQIAASAGANYVATDLPGTWEGIATCLTWSDAPTDPPVQHATDDEAYVIFTSGSTGTPKGVMITHAAAWNTIADINARIGLTGADRVLAVSALSFDLSVWDIFGPLAVGAALVLPPRGQEHDIPAWIGMMTRHGVTIWNSAPALFDLLVRARNAAQALRGLRFAMLSGDWIAPDMVRQAFALAPEMRLFALGGATEAAIWSVGHVLNRAPEGAVAAIAYGAPLANQTLHVRDTRMRPVPDWVSGDLYIGGRGLARGYLGDSQKTADAFVTDPVNGERLYKTGDMARWRGDGVLEFMGRRDTQIKIAGRRTELGEIEAVLTGIAGIKRAVVRPVDLTGHGTRLVAWVQADPDHTLPANDTIRQAAATFLPEHMLPAHILPVSDWPVTANGKLDIASLPKPVPEDRAKTVASGETERRLTVLLQEEMGTDGREISVTDGFFQLGASSVTLLSLHRRIVEEFRTELDVPLLFRLANIRALAAHLDGTDANTDLRAAATARAARRRSGGARRRQSQPPGPNGQPGP